MAADATAAKISTSTLVAATNLSVSLTGPGRRVELVHHGDVASAVYFDSYSAEPVDALTGGGADDEQVLLPGERLVVNVRRGAGEPVWLEFLCASNPTVTAALLPGGH
jgi:hypothetical protein